MYVVRPSRPNAAPVFHAKTFRQTVRWCLAAERDGTLQYPSYDIIGADSRLDEPGFMATFLPDRTRLSPARHTSRRTGRRPAAAAAQPG